MRSAARRLPRDALYHKASSCALLLAAMTELALLVRTCASSLPSVLAQFSCPSAEPTQTRRRPLPAHARRRTARRDRLRLADTRRQPGCGDGDVACGGNQPAAASAVSDRSRGATHPCRSADRATGDNSQPHIRSQLVRARGAHASVRASLNAAALVRIAPRHPPLLAHPRTPVACTSIADRSDHRRC